MDVINYPCPNLSKNMLIKISHGTWCHYDDVIMSTIASQITSLTIVYSTVYSDADQRKHQSSASLAFVWGIHRGPVNSPHKWPVTRKMFPFEDVIMWCWIEDMSQSADSREKSIHAGIVSLFMNYAIPRKQLFSINFLSIYKLCTSDFCFQQHTYIYWHISMVINSTRFLLTGWQHACGFAS